MKARYLWGIPFAFNLIALVAIGWIHLFGKLNNLRSDDFILMLLATTILGFGLIPATSDF